MIKAIIFDCFGVLVQASLEQFIDTNFSGNEIFARKAHELNNQCSLGLISYKEQIAGFSEMSGLSAEEVHSQMDNNPRNSNLLDYIKNELKPKYSIGFLSNAGDNWLDQLFTKEDIELFDDVILSCQVSMAKPDERIYKLAAERLGLDPTECVFVDDIYPYLLGAESVGMKTVLYKDFANFKKDFLF